MVLNMLSELLVQHLCLFQICFLEQELLFGMLLMKLMVVLIADGYTRATGKMSMVIAQNGPGITGLVTPIKTAYWNHTPLLISYTSSSK